MVDETEPVGPTGEGSWVTMAIDVKNARARRDVPKMSPGGEPDGEMALLSGSESDGELYKLAVGGDRGAVEALVDRHHESLVLYLRSKTNVVSVVDDAVGEAWLRFFRHLREAAENDDRALQKPESIRFWLYRTALNALNDQFRSSSRQTDLSQRATSEAEALGGTFYQPDELADLEGEERRSALRDAFVRLGDRCRELLGLLATDPPLSYAEVAELTGRPIGSIGPTRQRCLASLRQLMGVAP